MTEARRESAAGRIEPLLLRRAEMLLGDLTGVLSARIVANSQGQIEEIHLLTDQQAEPKQTVRNVESALLAQLGIKIDHRKVSVAQTRGPQKDWAAEELEAVEPQAAQRRYLFEGYEFERKLAQRVRCRVRLSFGSEEFVGSAEGADIESARLFVAAQATLNALELIQEGRVSFALDGAKAHTMFDLPVVVVALYGLSGRRRTFLSGSTPVTESPEHAAIFAALKATNRWITAH